MKIISIRQPWATLIALGEKRFETRSWATKHRGPLGIHASKVIDKEPCRREPFRSVLQAFGYDENNLPTGVIIATSRLADCFRINDRLGEALSAELDTGNVVDGHEYLFGDYTPGRFAWEIVDVKLIEPIPAKGQLSLWEFPVNQFTGSGCK